MRSAPGTGRHFVHLTSEACPPQETAAARQPRVAASLLRCLIGRAGYVASFNNCAALLRSRVRPAFFASRASLGVGEPGVHLSCIPQRGCSAFLAGSTRVGVGHTRATFLGGMVRLRCLACFSRILSSLFGGKRCHQGSHSLAAFLQGDGIGSFFPVCAALFGSHKRHRRACCATYSGERIHRPFIARVFRAGLTFFRGKSCPERSNARFALLRRAASQKSVSAVSGVRETRSSGPIERDPANLSVLPARARAGFDYVDDRFQSDAQKRHNPALLVSLLKLERFVDVMTQSFAWNSYSPADIPDLTCARVFQGIDNPLHTYQFALKPLYLLGSNAC